MTSKISEQEQAKALLSADAVRARARVLFDLSERNAIEGWEVDVGKLPACADFVVDVIRKNYPTLQIPFHARWRHFVFSGRDLWKEISARSAWKDADAKARAAFDLAIASVLLDAGAGAQWAYRDEETGIQASRSEGLALASLRMFERGAFADDDQDRLQASAQALAILDAAALADAFQVTPQNPLLGLEGRAALLNRLGRQVDARPDMFAREDTPRPGGLYDMLKIRAQNGVLHAPDILKALLEGLGPIWQNRPSLGGVSLGDCWPIGALGYFPLHKLSQWLAYSLIEPLQEAGVNVVDIDGLTGLAEYRNGGLFVDFGVLRPVSPHLLANTYGVSDPFVVAWRSLTVALLDEVAMLVRARLEVSAEDFPLARVLEGGTWAAGRVLAREKRADAGPPFTIISDGTVF